MAVRGDDKNLYAFKMTYFLLDSSTIIINIYIFFHSTEESIIWGPPYAIIWGPSNPHSSLGSLPPLPSSSPPTAPSSPR